MPQSRPIVLVVDDPPGSNVDFIARRLARRMAEDLGQNVIVENRAGDGVAAGAASVAKADPDGSTLYIASRSTALYPSLCEKIEYDFAKDFAPVAMIAYVPYVLVTGKHIRAVTLRELLDQDRSIQYGFTCASGDVGTTANLIFETLRERASLSWLDVPYDGDPSTVKEVLAGRTDFAIIGAPSALPHLGARGLRALAVFSGGRLPFLPAVPSIAEFGVGAAEVQGWLALVTRRGTPSQLIARLNSTIKKVLSGVSVGKKLMQLGYIIPATENTPAELRTFVELDTGRWTKLFDARRVPTDP